MTIPVTWYIEEVEGGPLVPHVTMADRALVTLNTVDEWKGDHSAEYVVIASAPPDSPVAEGLVMVNCQVQLELHKKYLVFATGEPPEADYCTPTAELGNATEAVQELDQLQKVEKERR